LIKIKPQIGLTRFCAPHFHFACWILHYPLL